LDSAAMAAWMAAEGITISHLVTPLAEGGLDQPWPPRPALRGLLMGGDRMRRGVARPVPFPVFNHYGPTEATVVCSRARIAPLAPGDGPLEQLIGRPLGDPRGHILAEALRRGAAGAVG